MDVIACNGHETASLAESIEDSIAETETDLDRRYEDEITEDTVSLDELDTPGSGQALEPDVTDSSVKVNDSNGIVEIANEDALFRFSLFPHVPPYVAFQSHDRKNTRVHPEIKKHMKWRLSSITPVIVRRTLANTGFRLMRKTVQWCGTWGKHMKSTCFKSVKPSQKINHFPGTFQLGRKDRLWRNLSRMMIKHSKREFGFVPRTYVLPQDLRIFRAACEKAAGKEKWIIKPPASAKGAGIHVVHRWSQIPKRRPVVVQQYLSKPRLIRGAKFDLRLYVLVTSFNPLKIYLYPDGLVRFASVKYVDDINYLSDRFMHLTNYSINKSNASYTNADSVDSSTGHKWALSTLWSHLEKEGVNVTNLWSTIKDMIAKTMISCEGSISSMTRANTTSRYCCYELFGIDVILDENLKPWLLEVNISPSLQCSSVLDTAVKGPLTSNVFNMAGYQLPARIPQEELDQLTERFNVDELCQNTRIYRSYLSKQTKKKQTRFLNSKLREDYLDAIIEDLTPDDVRLLLVYEDELTQIGKFEKIFPTADTHVYLQYFELPKYYNFLLDAWETRYADNRDEGIARLRQLCEAKFHLKETSKIA